MQLISARLREFPSVHQFRRRLEKGGSAASHCTPPEQSRAYSIMKMQMEGQEVRGRAAAVASGSGKVKQTSKLHIPYIHSHRPWNARELDYHIK